MQFVDLIMDPLQDEADRSSKCSALGQGLAYGANAAGLPYASAGKLALQPASSQIQPHFYAARLAAFTRNLHGKAREFAMASLTRVQSSGSDRVQQCERHQSVGPPATAVA